MSAGAATRMPCPATGAFFFEGFELAAADGPATGERFTEDHVLKQARVEALKYRYRDMGHLLACLDPLSACPTEHPLLDLSAFGLSEQDLDIPFVTRRFGPNGRAPLKDIVQALKTTYCRSIGVEYMHLQDPAERRWLQDRMEPVRNRPAFTRNEKVRILERLCRAAGFEAFLHKKYVAQTRFSIEGAETVIAMLDALTTHVAEKGCREIVLGMAHRGRLNVLTHILGKPYEDIFNEFSSCYDPQDLIGAGDVKYHNGYLGKIVTRSNRSLDIYLVNNPSHLESVDPVVEGVARARQDLSSPGQRAQILPLLLHGDAAFAGQGVVAETLNLSELKGYRTGGTIHLVINNQIGYTTLPEHARSTRYSTDMAKMLMVPVFHVHGENPEAAIHVTRLAADYRAAFAKDVVIDMVCYRRYGHNEGDDPYFTQPLMYDRIKARPSVFRLYARLLIEEKAATEAEIAATEKKIADALETSHARAQENACPFPKAPFYENWRDYHGGVEKKTVSTGVAKGRLVALSDKLNRVPPGFSLNPKIERLLEKRRQAVETGRQIDWANAEALAFASILNEAIPIRLSGQDSGRGTFSQRHSVLVDTKTGEPYVPLNHLGNQQAAFSVYNSMLSEAAVLGFEYGYSITQPAGLTLWEAQFGDFANNAQAVIDLYIASGESKWQRLSGLVMLLPHGYEGLGPEHSSARLERYLQLCAENNLRVCYPSTPAQYFHLLRRQVAGRLRKPLVVMAPKSLLRNPAAVSNLSEFTRGGFREIITADKAEAKTRRLICCSGKIYYDLAGRKAAEKVSDTAIVRIEQFYPFPEKALKQAVQRYKTVRQWVWVQEEPENMGAWGFLRHRLQNLVGQPFEYVGRSASASTATGFPGVYKQQQSDILKQAFR